MKRLTNLFLALFLLGVIYLPVANAQQQTAPTTNSQTSSGGSQGTPQQVPASPVLSTVPTVTGGLAPNVGDSGDTRSQITAGLQYSELFDSNFQNSSPSAGWDAISTIGGHFELRRTGAASELVLSYAGGGYIDPRNSSADSTYHQFQASETLHFRRWTLDLVDSFSFLPQSSFGFGGTGLGGAPFLGTPILNPGLIPGQGILSTPANRLSNSALAQIQYASSQRTAWTFSGSYGLLHYTSTGFLNSSDYGFSAGYNHQLTERDVIGFSYQFNATRYGPALPSINYSTILATYGRHISKELAFQAGFGPQLNQYTPVPGPGTGTHVGWNSNVGLSYLGGRTTTNVSFSHGINAGSGFLVGATTNFVVVGVSHPLGQYATVNGSFGMSQNSSLPQASSTTTSYNSEFVTIGVTRKLGRDASIYATYNLIRQGTNAVPCTGPVCAPPVLRHQIYVGFSWDMRPVELR